MHGTEPVDRPTDLSPADAPIPLRDRFMLYLFVAGFLLFAALLVGEAVARMLR